VSDNASINQIYHNLDALLARVRELTGEVKELQRERDALVTRVCSLERALSLAPSLPIVARDPKGWDVT
jgi:hypothetical protein